jgi:predicted O-methyltransferase YrrM
VAHSRTIINDDLYRYVLQHSRPISAEMQGLQADSEQHLYDQMRSTPEHAMSIAFFAKMINAKNIIEVGVFSGFVTLALAQQLPEASIIACDTNMQFVEIGEKYWHAAGVRERIDLRIAPAAETLDSLLADNKANQFDFIFIDADKPSYPEYYEKSLQLLRPGGVIAVDNTLFHGTVIEPDETSDSVRAIRKINKIILEDKRVDMIMLPVADGLTLAMKR